MADYVFTPEQRSYLYYGIKTGRSWQEIEATLPDHTHAEIKLQAVRMQLVHNMPGNWPQIREENEDGIVSPIGDPLLDALSANHCQADCVNLAVPVGVPKKFRKADTYSLVPSFASMVIER
jgi:hypothetical protein